MTKFLILIASFYAFQSQGETFDSLAVAEISFKGGSSHPGCHIIGGCKLYTYQVVKQNPLCGDALEIGKKFTRRFPIGEWYQPTPCRPGPYSRANCSNEYAFKHGKYAVIGIKDDNLHLRDISALLDFKCY